jgi:hypothetical protein
VTEPTVGSDAGVASGSGVPPGAGVPSGSGVPSGAGVAPGAGAGSGETGHPEVDAALAELTRADRLPPDQQIAAYESVHRTLQDTLGTIEQS